MGSWSWTITGIIRLRSRPPWPRRSKGGETDGWWCCFSRIAIPGRETCWRILRRRSTNRTCLFLTDIYAAGEQPIPGVSGAKLADIVRAAGHPSVTFVERKDQLVDQVLPHLKSGDLVITLGAGDIWKTGLGLLARLTPTG